ncbi:7-cyano-7-deazaguanine synthase QueC [Streptomyces sp. AMCC400023]|uniref:7-cyano-7-deazaguanine synthase QueC n=1 Tax=Streptomyces sp. AMCC400023 TaxID=2056258 RepID=UPI001F011996|nr:7-cyano-7-deazaguanine synthase QueC [Streptomyces sp. AMCC400023]UJV42965.1 7-cyano-7-deazaguanine synthase QueC [Streptomyces sp. AMCC400023]
MNRPPLAVLAFSGGMDSTTLAAHYQWLGYDLLLLSFDYGQRHARELEAARTIAAHYRAEHHVVDLTAVGALMPGSALTDRTVDVPEGHYAAASMRATVVPNRNAIMANVAAGIASARGALVVALGIHAGDHAVYPDCRPAFLDALQTSVTAALDGFPTPTVEAPFLHMTKTDIARQGAGLGVPFVRTWSCYQGGALHCGRCGTCVERREAFNDAGLTDPTRYEPAHEGTV